MVKKFLDLGCGKGEFCNYLAKKNRQALIYGADINKNNIKYANDNKLIQSQIFKLSSAEKVPFKNNYFDEIYCFEVLEHVTNLPLVLSEIRRILKNGGKFIFSVPTKESEEILEKLNPNYPKQIGHRRKFTKKIILTLLNKYNLQEIYYSAYNSMEHLFWVHIFRRGGKIIDQLGSTDVRAKKYIRILNFILSKDVFYLGSLPKKRWHRVSVYVLGAIFYPVGRLLDLFLVNKRQKITSIIKK